MQPAENSPFRIWIADDDDEFRETLGKSLSRDGRVIRLFPDGEELIQVLMKESAFDVIVSDLLMPKADGLQVLEKSKKSNPDGVVIIMTGYASLDTAIQAIRGGAYDYIRKPFKLDEIEIVVKNACEKIALVRENRRLLQRLKETMEEVRDLRKPPPQSPKPEDSLSFPNLDHKIAGMDVLLKQMIPSDYDFKDREHRKIIYEELQKLVEYRKEGLLSEAEFFSMKHLLLQSLKN